MAGSSFLAGKPLALLVQWSQLKKNRLISGIQLPFCNKFYISGKQGFLGWPRIRIFVWVIQRKKQGPWFRCDPGHGVLALADVEWEWRFHL